MDNYGKITTDYSLVNKMWVDTAINQAISRLNTQWFYPSINNQFIEYGDYTTVVKYKKVGQAVYLQGQIKPTASIKLNANNVVLFTLPVGYRPAYVGVWLCQGSGTSFWGLRVQENGEVIVYRARDIGGANGAWLTVPNTYWMPFSVSFVTEE